MARHPWVAQADHGVRFGVQLVVGHHALRRLVEAGRRVEALGFDGLFVCDHPAQHADPWVCLAALAAATKRVRLGSVVGCVFYRHPAHLARLAADLDNLSGGRLVLGLGVGWLESEFRAFDLPFGSAAERQAGLEEALAIVEGVWGPRPFSFAGRQFRVEGMRVLPPPVQRPRPPVMIGGNGERVTLRQVARLADACNVDELRTVEGRLERGDGAATIRRKLEVLRRHCAEVGRPFEEVLRTHFTLQLVMAPTAGELAAKLARGGTAGSSSGGEPDALTAVVGQSAVVAGTADEVVAYYRDLAAAGIQYFVVQVDSTDHQTLGLLAREVVPRVR